MCCLFGEERGDLKELTSVLRGLRMAEELGRHWEERSGSLGRAAAMECGKAGTGSRWGGTALRMRPSRRRWGTEAAWAEGTGKVGGGSPGSAVCCFHCCSKWIKGIQQTWGRGRRGGGRERGQTVGRLKGQFIVCNELPKRSVVES